jgi:hypothetical protein
LTGPEWPEANLKFLPFFLLKCLNQRFATHHAAANLEWLAGGDLAGDLDDWV